LLAYETITPYSPAQELLNRELARIVYRITGRSPENACTTPKPRGAQPGVSVPSPADWICTWRCI
jgi:hypothetical protein